MAGYQSGNRGDGNQIGAFDAWYRQALVSQPAEPEDPYDAALDACAPARVHLVK